MNALLVKAIRLLSQLDTTTPPFAASPPLTHQSAQAAI
jgi:hypothetical protein